LFLAGISGAMAVGFGAYGAHALAGEPTAAQWVEKASRYQMYHAVALLAVSLMQREGGRLVCLAGLLFAFGSLFFCGALYGLALLSLPLNALAPVGGCCFILGWLALAAAALWDRA
jgi:uncharacterized membrane protein YgdD (TMEM256/DUF423 family)